MPAPSEPLGAAAFDDDFADAARLLDQAGLAPRGAIPIERYDALVPPPWRSRALAPGARSALVIGAGGRALGEASRAAPEAALARDPLDAFVVRVVGEAACAVAARGALARAAFAFETRGGRYADYVALGREAGLGAPSRLGLLVHPVYGPWLSLRALLLVDAPLAATPVPDGFAPCEECPAPCASACPGGAVGGRRFDVAACGATRARTPGCRQRCDARHACVLGRAHAYAASVEAHHMDASRARGAAGPPGLGRGVAGPARCR